MVDNKDNIVEDKLDITDNNSIVINYIKILLSHKKSLMISVLIIGLIVTFYMYFISKPIFYSSAVVKANSKSVGLNSLFSGSALSDISGIDEISGGSSSSKELSLYSQILTSRRCVEETISKFQLMEVYDQKYLENAVKEFREKIIEISKDSKSGTMEIGVNDISPERARDIASFLILQLNKINTELNIQSAKNYREFIQQRYETIKKDLTQAEDSLKQYQQINGLAPDITAKAVLQTQVQIEAQMKTEELKLDLLKKMLSPDQSDIKLQEEKINSLKKQLVDIQKADDTEIGVMHLKNSPDKVMNFLRLQRNVEIQNKLLVFILPLFEQAKIEEKKEMPSVQVLDQPNLPEIKKKPKRVITILMSILVSFVFFSISIILYEALIKKVLKSLNTKNA